MRGIRSFFSWVLALGLIAVLAIAADAKLFGDPEQANIVFATLAERTGQALFEPSGRFMFGIAEAFAVVLLILPFSRRIGAVLSLILGGLMMWAHLTPALGQEVPLAIGSEQLDGGSAFYLTLGITAVSGLLVFMHPGRKPKRLFR